MFSSSIIFFACFLKEVQNLTIQLFPRYKVCLFSMWSNSQIVDIEYQQRICSSIYAVEELSGLFAHPSIFLIKDSMSAWLMYVILSDFIYWLSSNISSFSKRIAIPRKSLFLHTFSWDLSLFSVLKEKTQYKPLLSYSI